MQTDVPVLIVGAGPTGLMMALVLQHYGIPFRIIDKKPEPTKTSNAVGLQARTLELLTDLNLSDAFLKTGKKIKSGCLYSNGQLLGEVQFHTIPSLYSYLLIVPQSFTEKTLEAHLAQRGQRVQRNTALTQIEKKDQLYQIAVQNQGQTEHFTTRYLIAADGAHSTVRGLSNMAFKGHDLPQQFILADFTINTELSMDKVHAFYSKAGLFGIIPLPNGEVRLLGDVSSTKVSHEAQDIENAVKKMAAHRTLQKIHLEKSSWLSTFWIHSKLISNLQHERIFFAGDAAHIHSPIGAQGMNTGMQDAYNLGWKLALVLQGDADEKILKSYHQERYPVVLNIVKETDKLTRLLVSRSLFSRLLRHTFLRALLRSKKLNHTIATNIAMLSTHYSNSPIIHYPSTMSNRSPQPGERLPEILLTPHPFTYYLQGKKHWLLIFCGKNPASSLQQRQHLVKILTEDYAWLIDVCLIGANDIKTTATTILDADFIIHRQFNVEQAALCLVRPDKYLAFCSASLNLADLKKYLEKTFSGKKK